MEESQDKLKAELNRLCDEKRYYDAAKLLVKIEDVEGIERALDDLTRNWMWKLKDVDDETWSYAYFLDGFCNEFGAYDRREKNITLAVDCKHIRREGSMKARTCLRTVIAALSVLLSVYAILYMGRFIKVNCCGWSEDIKASQLPKEVVSCVELYDDPPESVGVYVLHRDIDGDGIEELIVDSGTNARGAANWWYTIWKKQSSGVYRDIGFFCCDSYLFVPGWGIRGLPGILCNHGKVEWVPWRGGQYSCRGPI